MAGSKGLFVRQHNTGTLEAPVWVATTPVEARRALGGMFVQNSPGVPRTGLLDPPDTVVTATAGMSYTLSAVHPVVHRTAGEGVYEYSFQGTTTVATAVAPGTDSRWDLIWAKQNDTEKGDPDNLVYFGVTNGAPSAVPSKPTASIPDGALVLAEARIYAGTTATQSAPNTLAQTFPYAALNGTPVKVRSKADRDTITAPRVGMEVIRMDRDNFVQTYTGNTAGGASGWEYLGLPKRTYITVNGTTMTNTAGAVSRLIATVSTAPKPYARRMTLGGSAAMVAGAVSSGNKTVYLALSFLQSTVTNAQARTAFAWVSPGSYLISSGLRPARDILVGANANPMGRIWVDDVGGSASTTMSIDPSFTEFYVDEIPEKD